MYVARKFAVFFLASVFAVDVQCLEACFVSTLMSHFQVIGIVTRKDLARYRFVRHGCQVGIEELKISTYRPPHE